MRILVAHNYYRQSGGEDTVFKLEKSLLRHYGHEVIEHIESNQQVRNMSNTSLILQTIWSEPTYKTIQQLIEKERPDIAHFHNTFPLISPSAYYACREAHIPVVQSLHNPRLLCPAASFYRDGHLCIDCLGKTPPWPALLHACYHHSRTHTAVVASMLTIHRWLKTWKKMVGAYIVFTDFYRKIFIEGGFPSKKIYVKPHFVPRGADSATHTHLPAYALFIGRLDPEKGIWTLLRAWSKLKIPLKIRGDGQLESVVREFIQRNEMQHVELIGHLSEGDLSKLIRGASFVVIPSEGYYETFGMVAIESYSQGIPVLASRIGVLTEIVIDGKTGLHFSPGDPLDLASKAEMLWNNSDEIRRMGKEAFKEYEQKYTPEHNYPILMNIYSSLIEARI